MDFHPLTHPYDVPIDFNDLFGLSHFVGGVDAIGGPVTAGDESIVEFHEALNGTLLPAVRWCCDGNIIAYTPHDDINYAEEERWYALVVGVNEHGGTVLIRPMLSGRRLNALAAHDVEGLNNADDLLFELEEAEVDDEAQLLCMNGVHDLPFESITHVLSIDEFTSIGFDGSLGVILSQEGWIHIRPLFLF